MGYDSGGMKAKDKLLTTFSMVNHKVKSSALAAVDARFPGQCVSICMSTMRESMLLCTKVARGFCIVRPPAKMRTIFSGRAGHMQAQLTSLMSLQLCMHLRLQFGALRVRLSVHVNARVHEHVRGTAENS